MTPAPVPSTRNRISLLAAMALNVLGAGLISLGYCVLRIFVLGRYELQIGSPVANLILLMGIFALLAAPLIALGAAMAWVFIPMVSERFQARLRWAAFTSGAVAMATVLLVLELVKARDPSPGEQALILIMLTAAVNFFLDKMLRTMGILPTPNLNECAACGYDLRASKSERCPECGAPVPASSKAVQS